MRDLQADLEYIRNSVPCNKREYEKEEWLERAIAAEAKVEQMQAQLAKYRESGEQDKKMVSAWLAGKI